MTDPTPIFVTKCEPAWFAEGPYWRLHLKYHGPKGEKRTYLKLDGLDHQRRDARAAAARAKAFKSATDPMWSDFLAKHTPRATVAPASIASRTCDEKTLGWLLSTCLRHPKLWADVANPANYQSSVRTLALKFGDLKISDFEPANGGRGLVERIADELAALPGRNGCALASGTVRKLLGMIHQALQAVVGSAHDATIVHPVTGAAMLSQVPRFPTIKKGPPRTAIVTFDCEKVIFEIIADKIAAAKADEEAFEAKVAVMASGRAKESRVHGWSRAPRFSSKTWTHYSRLILFLLETGMRRGEALYCGPHTHGSIDHRTDRGALIATVPVITLPALITKTSEPRAVNMTQTVVDMIPMLDADAEPMRLVYKTQTVEIERAWFPLHIHQCDGLWMAVRKSAAGRGVDLSKIVLHSLRHTNATRLRARGLPIDELSRHLGHSDIATTLRNYEHSGDQKTAMSARFFRGQSISINDSVAA